jgi:hypothetical protein
VRPIEISSHRLLSLQPGLARIKSIRDVFVKYEFHVEPKSADAIREIPGKESAKAARISERAIKAIRNGHARPSANMRNLLLQAAKRLRS